MGTSEPYDGSVPGAPGRLLFPKVERLPEEDAGETLAAAALGHPHTRCSPITSAFKPVYSGRARFA